MNSHGTQVQWKGRSDRFHRIVARLRREEYATPQQLADALGVCGKTIQRDLRYMRDTMRTPVAYDMRKKGWCLTDRSVAVPLAFVAERDLQAIMVLGQAISQYEGTPLGDSMHQAFEQLLSLLVSGNTEDEARVRRFAKRISFVGAPPPPMDNAIWKAIVVALQSDQQLELVYRKGGSGAPTARKFDPYGLIVRNRDWYLHGYCHLKKFPLTFFLPYIAKARAIEGEYYEVPADFDLHAYTRDGYMGMRAAGEPIRKVVLRFSPECAAAARSAPFARNQHEVVERSGHLRVTFKTDAFFQLWREIMRWGSCVEVLAPADLRRHIVMTARKLIALYRRRAKSAGAKRGGNSSRDEYRRRK